MKEKTIRVISFFSGVFILALGSVTVQKSGVGIAPMEALAYNVSAASGLSVGTWLTISGLVLVVLQLIMIKKLRFKTMLQLTFMFIYGFFVDMLLATIFKGDIQTTNVTKWLLFAIGQIISFVGIGLFVASEVLLAPLEGATITLADKMKKEFKNARWFIEAIILGLAILAFIVFDLDVSNIGLGTLIIFIGSGPFIQIFIEFFSKKIVAISKEKEV